MAARSASRGGPRMTNLPRQASAAGRRYLRWMLCALCWLAPAAALAQESSLPVRQLVPAQIAAALRAGGNVIYFRHTSTDFSQDDRRMKSYDDCAAQRNLTDKGREEARRIGAALRALGVAIGDVMASPYCRTVETATLAFGRARRMQEARGGPVADRDPQRYVSLRRIAGSAPPAGTNNVIVSHGNPFMAIAGPPYLAEGEAAVLAPLGDSKFRVIARIRLEDWDALLSAQP